MKKALVTTLLVCSFTIVGNEAQTNLEKAKAVLSAERAPCKPNLFWGCMKTFVGVSMLVPAGIEGTWLAKETFTLCKKRFGTPALHSMEFPEDEDKTHREFTQSMKTFTIRSTKESTLKDFSYAFGYFYTCAHASFILLYEGISEIIACQKQPEEIEVLNS